MSIVVRFAGFSMAMALVGCGNDHVASPGTSADAGSADAGSGGTRSADAGPLDAGPDVARARPTDPFNGDCSSARWASVSDECWSCFCTTCKDTLNKCNTGCVKGISCATENHLLAGVVSDLGCEGRAFTEVCQSDPDINAAASAVTPFDLCLIGSRDPVNNHLRACEAECGITYTGDVCERFPPPRDGG